MYPSLSNVCREQIPLTDQEVFLNHLNTYQINLAQQVEISGVDNLGASFQLAILQAIEQQSQLIFQSEGEITVGNTDFKSIVIQYSRTDRGILLPPKGPY